MGHTFAHSYEAACKYSKNLNHGEAVLLGLSSVSEFSMKKRILNPNVHQKIQDHITCINKSLKIKNYFSKKDIRKLIKFMKNDKKNTNKKINLILIKKIGQVTFNNFIDEKEILKFINSQFYSI